MVVPSFVLLLKFEKGLQINVSIETRMHKTKGGGAGTSTELSGSMVREEGGEGIFPCPLVAVQTQPLPLVALRRSLKEMVQQLPRI